MLRAQMTNTLYFMDRIPEFHQMNPAFQPKCNAYVGLLPTFEINGGIPFNLKDIYTYNPSLDSLITIFHPLAAANAKDKFINNLDDVPSFYMNSNIDFLSFGFRVSDWYWTFGVSNRLNTEFNASKDYVSLLTKGMELNKTYNLGNLGVNITDYVEFALGASKKVNEEFTIGGKGKFLVGLMDFSVDNSTFNLNTSNRDTMYTLGIKSDLSYNGFNPFAQMPDTIGKQSMRSYSGDTILNNLTAMNSKGFAIDLGIKYTGIEKLSLSASVLDLGFIRWGGNVFNTKIKGDYIYRGIENMDFTKLDSVGSKITSISDSITNAFSITQSSSSYTTMLPTRIILGAEYFPEEYFSVGLMSLSQFNRSKFYQQIVLSANLRPLNMIMLSGSYSMFNNGFSSFGAGVTLRLSSLQFYMISDNIPFKFGKSGQFNYVPYMMKTFNFRFGLNLVFGCNGNKRKEKDKPMIYE